MNINGIDYKLSEFKNIPNFDKYKIDKEGVIISFKSNNPKVIRSYKNKSGNKVVDLCNNGKYTSININTLIKRLFFDELYHEKYKNFIDIPNFEGRYKINQKGDILSLGNGFRSSEIKLLSKSKDKAGYDLVTLNNKTYKVHRLVAETFILNPDNLPQVNHKDEDKSNNQVDNLEWCNSLYNMNYGTRNIRSSIKQSFKIKRIDLINNKEFIYSSINEAARNMNIVSAAIKYCLRKGSIYKLQYKFVKV